MNLSTPTQELIMTRALDDLGDRLETAREIAKARIEEGKDLKTIEFLVAHEAGVSLRKAKEYLGQLNTVGVISLPKPKPKIKEVRNPNEIRLC